MLLMPTAALAAPGIVTTTVSLKAGPGEGFADGRPHSRRHPGVNIHWWLQRQGLVRRELVG